MMAKKKDMSEVAREVVAEYGKQGSLKAVASTLKLSEGYGKTLSEVAYSLGISEKVLNNYLPYTKGEYGSDTPSANALKIRASRQRSKANA